MLLKVSVVITFPIINCAGFIKKVASSISVKKYFINGIIQISFQKYRTTILYLQGCSAYRLQT